MNETAKKPSRFGHVAEVLSRIIVKYNREMYACGDAEQCTRGVVAHYHHSYRYSFLYLSSHASASHRSPRNARFDLDLASTSEFDKDSETERCANTVLYR